MTLDRWRGRPGLLGWLVLRWDILCLRCQMRRWRRPRTLDRVSDAWLDDHHRH